MKLLIQLGNIAVALSLWPLVLYQIFAFYLGSENAISHMRASKADLKQENRFWLSVEPVIAGLMAFGLIYFGWVWTGLYLAMGVLAALIYEGVVRRLE